jgi:hypothetical protein
MDNTGWSGTVVVRHVRKRFDGPQPTMPNSHDTTVSPGTNKRWPASAASRRGRPPPSGTLGGAGPAVAGADDRRRFLGRRSRCAATFAALKSYRRGRPARPKWELEVMWLRCESNQGGRAATRNEQVAKHWLPGVITQRHARCGGGYAWLDRPRPRNGWPRACAVPRGIRSKPSPYHARPLGVARRV